ncbi:MAG: hypothetical protein QOF40_1682 [Actinomycetota bacterium]|jgi:hypothetical protein|nr:hypothetical protein [Actinomycetota bacterium]
MRKVVAAPGPGVRAVEPNQRGALEQDPVIKYDPADVGATWASLHGDEAAARTA